MEIEEISSVDGATLIRLAGRMDVQGTEAIDLKFTAYAVKDKGAVIVDMEKVSFLASIGIRTLILVAKALRSKGGKMVLMNPGSEVNKVLEMSGVDSLIPVCGSLAAAQAALAA